MALPRVVGDFALTRAALATLLSLALLISPLYSAPSAAYGTVVFANRAQLGGATASVGATVFSGDRLSTDPVGSVQIRAEAARLLLASSSSATLAQEDNKHSATLTAGTATFSTANSEAFTLHVASATIRPNTDRPTIGKVTVLNARELIVESVRGSLQIAVEDDVREIPEKTAYRVVLDPNAPEPQGPKGAGTKGTGRPPIKAAKSRFVWYAVAIVGGGTWWVIHEACESGEGWGVGC